MKRAVLAVTLLAAAGTAPVNAGTYLGLGIGTAPAVSEQTDTLDSDGRSAKVLLGTRMGQFSLEGAIGGHGLLRPIDGGRAYGDLYHLSGAAKFNLPLGNNFEVFGRLGLQHTLLRSDLVPGADASGNGLLFGAGFEYRLNLGVGAGSIFVDYQINKAELTGDDDDRLTYDLTTRTWTLGLTIGI